MALSERNLRVDIQWETVFEDCLETCIECQKESTNGRNETCFVKAIKQAMEKYEVETACSQTEIETELEIFADDPDYVEADEDERIAFDRVEVIKEYGPTCRYLDKQERGKYYLDYRCLIWGDVPRGKRLDHKSLMEELLRYDSPIEKAMEKYEVETENENENETENETELDIFADDPDYVEADEDERIAFDRVEVIKEYGPTCRYLDKQERGKYYLDYRGLIWGDVPRGKRLDHKSLMEELLRYESPIKKISKRRTKKEKQ